MKYSLVIFDLDGTILDTLDDIADSCNAVLKKNNFPVHTKNEIKTFIGNGIPKLIERSLPPATDTETKEKITQEFIAYYRAHSAIKTSPFNGMIDFLTELKNARIKIAVNTNKHEGTAVDICNKYFPGLIDAVTGGRPDTPHKPDPTGVEKILSLLNEKKENAIYVGDSDVDILTAQNTGIDCSSAAWGFRGEEFLKAHGAKKIVHDVNELKEIILG